MPLENLHLDPQTAALSLLWNCRSRTTVSLDSGWSGTGWQDGCRPFRPWMRLTAQLTRMVSLSRFVGPLGGPAGTCPAHLGSLIRRLSTPFAGRDPSQCCSLVTSPGLASASDGHDRVREEERYQ